MRKKRHSGPGIDTAHRESREMKADQHFMALLETSSLGTPAARQIRSATPAAAVEDVRQRRAKRHPPEPAASQPPAIAHSGTTLGSREDKARPEAGKRRGRPAIAGTKWLHRDVVPVAAALVIVIATAITAAVFTPRANFGASNFIYPSVYTSGTTATIPDPGSAPVPHHSAKPKSAAVLIFKPGSASLPPDADSILARLAGEARARHLWVAIFGYASPDEGGSDAFTQELSLARANAVRSRLVALGLPPDLIMLFDGFGTHGVTSQACGFGETLCARMRRVDIILYRTAAHGG